VTECTLVIDGTAVPLTDFRFDTPRHVHRLILPPGAEADSFILGASGFGVSFCAPAALLAPYLDSKPHDIAIRPHEAAVELPVFGVRLTKYAEHGGLAYGYGVVTDKNHQVATWKELVTNG
jgi:hypothetical protein